MDPDDDYGFLRKSRKRCHDDYVYDVLVTSSTPDDRKNVKMKGDTGRFIACYDGRCWPVVPCGSIYVTSDDIASRVKTNILTSSEKKKKSSKHALTIASSFGHVHAFLRDNDKVLKELDRRDEEDPCLMLIKKPKPSAKQMLKSQSWANLTTSDSNLYQQLDGGFHGDSRKHHKYRMKRKQSDLQQLPSDGVSSLKVTNENTDQRVLNQSITDTDDDWHSEVMSENSYLTNGHSSVQSEKVDNRHSHGRYNKEINNNKKLTNNSRMYRSHGDIYRQPQRLYDITNEKDKDTIRSDEFYKKPVAKKREPQIKEEEELDPVSRSHSLGDLTTGLTLSLVGQKKSESVQYIPGSNKNHRLNMQDNMRISPKGGNRSMNRLSPSQTYESKQSLKDSRKYTSDINLSSVSRNGYMNNFNSGSKTLDKPPAKPRRSLPALPNGDVTEKKKHYAEVVKQRMSLQSSNSASSSRQSLLSPYSAESAKGQSSEGTPQSDKEVSDLLEPSSLNKSSDMCNNNSSSNVAGSHVTSSDTKSDNDRRGKDSTGAPSGVRSCDSGTATVTSLSSTVDSGYLTNDADNDMYSSSSYTKSLQKSAQSLYSGNKLQVYSYGNGSSAINRQDSGNSIQREIDDATNFQNHMLREQDSKQNVRHVTNTYKQDSDGRNVQTSGQMNQSFNGRSYVNSMKRENDTNSGQRFPGNSQKAEIDSRNMMDSAHHENGSNYSMRNSSNSGENFPGSGARNTKGLSSTLPRTHPYNRGRGDNPGSLPTKPMHQNTPRRHTAVINVSVSTPGSSQIIVNDNHTFSTSTPNNMVKNVPPNSNGFTSHKHNANSGRPEYQVTSPHRGLVNNSAPVNYTQNNLNYSASTNASYQPSSYQNHPQANRHASLGSMKDVNVVPDNFNKTNSAPVPRPRYNSQPSVSHPERAPPTQFAPVERGQHSQMPPGPHSQGPVERIAPTTGPVNFAPNSRPGEHLVKPVDRENHFSNPTSPVIMKGGNPIPHHRKGSNSADLLSSQRMGTIWNQVTSPKSVGMKVNYTSQNLQNRNNFHGNNVLPNNSNATSKIQSKDMNSNFKAVHSDISSDSKSSNPPKTQVFVTSPIVPSQEHHFVPVNVDMVESPISQQYSAPNHQTPAHYSTLPSNFKQHSEKTVTTDEEKSPNRKKLPSLFQILQYHDLYSIRISVEDKSIILNNLRMCDCTITMPTSCKSPKRECQNSQTPKGKYAQLGGPGSAFKPVKSQGSTMVPVSMVTVADISKQLNSMCDVGSFQKGDIFVEVDERLVVGETLTTIKSLINISGDDVTFTVARAKQVTMTSPLPTTGQDVDVLRKQIDSMKLDLKRKERAITELNAMLPWKQGDDETAADTSKNNINNSSQSDSLLNGLSEDEFIV